MKVTNRCGNDCPRYAPSKINEQTQFSKWQSGSVIWFSPKRIPSLNRGRGSVETPGDLSSSSDLNARPGTPTCLLLPTERRHSPEVENQPFHPGVALILDSEQRSLETKCQWSHGSLSGELPTGEPARCCQGHRLVREQI